MRNQHSLRLPAVALWLATVGVFAAVAPVASAELSPLSVSGRHLVNDRGEVVQLRGCNIGGWLLLEPWMLGMPQGEPTEHGHFPDQATILRILDERFGPERAHALMEAYRAGFMTPRDFELIRSFGFNVVRLPIHYSLIEDEGTPMRLKADAFKWIDHAIAMSRDAGLYVILDLHGVPGGQSIDAPTGEIDRNELWESAEAQARTVWIWRELASRYGNAPVVVAYDVVNEPFGNFKDNVSPLMRDLFGRIHDAIREVDPQTLIYAPGTLQGIAFYGDPADQGWTNVGFTEHAYPGLFGWGETSVRGHQRYVSQWVADRHQRVRSLDVPYLMGEFNVVFDAVGGDELMQVYFDLYAELGWSATMWSYKIFKHEAGVGPSNWYLVTNDQPFELRDLKTASYKELLARFEGLATMPLAVDESLRHRLTTPGLPAEIRLPAPNPPFAVAREDIPGFVATDVGHATSGGQHLAEDGRLVIDGGGDDIFNRSDAFRFLHRPVSGHDGMFVRIDSLLFTDQYAKAGVMIRDSTAADSAHALVHVTPTGRIVFAQRDAAGELTDEETLGVPGFPAGVGLVRRGDRLEVHWSDSAGRWNAVERPSPRFDGGQIGLAVLAHHDAALTRAIMTTPSEERAPVDARGDSDAHNLLANGSFEVAASGEQSARAEGWSRWGHWMDRVIDWTPVRDGRAIMSYQHWQVEDSESSGVWQDVSDLKPGQLYRFEVFANLDPGAGGGAAASAVELRIESVRTDGSTLTLTLATHTWDAEELARGDRWSKLSIDALATQRPMRVLIVVYPNETRPRDGALKFDQASLVFSEVDS
ncbi:MAG: cellulase family glycosylhydrolase [Planctomycetota bacterium]